MMPGTSFFRSIVSETTHPDKPGNKIFLLECGHVAMRYTWRRKVQTSLCKQCEIEWRWSQLR